MSIQIDISADTGQAEEKLSKLRRAFERPVFLGLVGERLLAWVNENFRKGGAETPWELLSANTIAGRRGVGWEMQPLRDTGRLAQSFVYRVFPEEVWVGTEDAKAVWHHLGTEPRTITTQPPGRPSRTVSISRRTSRPYRRPGALMFMTPAGPVFRRSVHHPGIPARPLLPSKDLARRLAQGVLEAYVEAVSQGQEPSG